MTDHYATLNVPVDADDATICAAYRRLALRFHPDRNGGANSEDMCHFLAIKQAYDVLSDPVTRMIYDSSVLDTCASSLSTSLAQTDDIAQTQEVWSALFEFRNGGFSRRPPSRAATPSVVEPRKNCPSKKKPNGVAFSRSVKPEIPRQLLLRRMLVGERQLPPPHQTKLPSINKIDGQDKSGEHSRRPLSRATSTLADSKRHEVFQRTKDVFF